MEPNVWPFGLSLSLADCGFVFVAIVDSLIDGLTDSGPFSWQEAALSADARRRELVRCLGPFSPFRFGIMEME